MRSTLSILSGDDAGTVIHLGTSEVKVLGRGSACDVVLQDAGVSRRHCRLATREGACLVHDLGSRNGTVVNGRRITEEVRLADGDIVELGMTRMAVRIHLDDGAAPTGPVAGKERPSAEVNVEPTLDMQPRIEVVGDSVHDALVHNAPPGHSEKGGARLALQGEEQEQELLGTTLGGCRLEERIGEDEISHLYRAVQVSMERPVAMKVLRPAMTADGQAVERFIRAARAGGKLTHPNIVQVYDAGAERGIYFIAFEYTGGKSVQHLMHERRRKRELLSLKEAVWIAEQVAGALEYAHAQAIFHRNVTPENILLTGHGVAKLTNLGFAQGLGDFGLPARLSPEERLAAMQHAAPEVLVDARSASARSDLYSLGTVLFYMVTGQRPFRAADEADLARKIRDGERQDARQLRRELPDELARIIERAMAAAPHDRYVRAADLHSALHEARERFRA